MKGPYSQSYGFSSSHVWMWELDHKDGWVLKIDVFELWCWRRLLRVSWHIRRSNKSILEEINLDYSLEGRMLKLQYFGPLMWRADSLERPWCWKSLKAKGERVKLVRQHHQLNVSKFWERVEDRGAWCATVHGVTKSQTQLSDWRATTLSYPLPCNQYSWGPLGLMKFHDHCSPLRILGKMARNKMECWFLWCGD